MTRDDRLTILRQCLTNPDTEAAHIEADKALLAYINDPEITEAYDVVGKWYA